MIDLVIASKNLHKIREIKFILKDIKDLDIYSLNDFPDFKPPPETGNSFEENAKAKAIAAAKALNKRVLADDSGLVIPALDGAPGIYSARYAGENCSDKANRKKLIEELEKLPEHKRVGYFTSVMVLADENGNVEKCVHGYCEGTLLTEERGGNGFGYDSLFVKYDYNKSLAELKEDTKNKVSHRRRALDKLLTTLEVLCAT